MATRVPALIQLSDPRVAAQLVFTNAKEYNNVSGLLVNDITDHLPIFAFCDYPDLKRQEKKVHTKNGLNIKTPLISLLIMYQK